MTYEIKQILGLPKQSSPTVVASLPLKEHPQLAKTYRALAQIFREQKNVPPLTVWHMRLYRDGLEVEVVDMEIQ